MRLSTGEVSAASLPIVTPEEEIAQEAAAEEVKSEETTTNTDQPQVSQGNLITFN